MKPSKEAAAILKILSVFDNFEHVGNELATLANEHQDQNFKTLVIGYNTIKVILGE